MFSEALEPEPPVLIWKIDLSLLIYTQVLLKRQYWDLRSAHQSVDTRVFSINHPAASLRRINARLAKAGLNASSLDSPIDVF